MKKAKFTRKHKTIVERDDEGAEVRRQSFEFVNEAKRESWAIQMREDGALGRGILRRA